MKKFIIALYVLVCALSLVSCGEEEQKDIFAKGEGAMTYAEYAKAELNDEVCIEAFIQAKQSWWENKGVGVGTFYTEDKDGAYFIYELPCSEADYNNNLVIGAKIRVTGKIGDFAGEKEIIDATYEILEGSYISTPKDLTDAFVSGEVSQYQNQKFTIKGAQIVAKNDGESAFYYGWNNSGNPGDDVYFDIKVGENTYSFVIESYLCGKDTDVYKAATALTVGATVDVVGFLYWYEGPQAHITGITVK